jgi:hypothetical protein
MFHELTRRAIHNSTLRFQKLERGTTRPSIVVGSVAESERTPHIHFEGLQEIEWVVLRGRSSGSMHGYWVSEAWRGSGIRHDEAWRNWASGSIVCRTDIRSRVSARKPPYAGCSVIRTCGSSGSTGAQKNRLRWLRSEVDRVVRPADAAGSRPVERRVPHCAGTRGAARGVPHLRRREARAAGFPGGQSALHQALCVLCRPPLPAGFDP